MTKKEFLESDELWKKDKERYQWELPKTNLILRLPVIRKIRFIFYNFRIHVWANMWDRVGIGFGGPNQYDLWIVYAISRGWC